MLSFFKEFRVLTYLYANSVGASSILIIAPAGASPLGHSCVAALEKGETIDCELRLAVAKMKNSHSQRLNVSLH